MATPAFSLSITDTPTVDTLDVIQFTGEEGISVDYQFEVNFEYVTLDPTTNPGGLIGKTASLSIDWGGGVPERIIHGLIVELRMGRRLVTALEVGTNEYRIQCRALLRPKLHLLTRNRRSRVFEHQRADEIISSILTQAGFTAADFQVELNEEDVYDVREYCVQYEESDFAFISRLMEQEGLFYFFDQSGSSETLIITDKNVEELIDAQVIPEGGAGTYPYDPNRTRLVAEEDEVWDFTAHSRLMTTRSYLVDDNFEDFTQPYNTPNKPETAYRTAYLTAFGDALTNGRTFDHNAADAGGQAAADDVNVELRDTEVDHGLFFRQGRDFVRPQNDPKKIEASDGGTYEDDQQYRDGREARVSRMQTVRAQEFACQRNVFTGASECAKFTAGYPFTLTGHYISEDPVAGDAFLLTQITHYGGPAAHARTEVDSGLNDADMVYYNTFSCISQVVQFRAPRTTPVPRVPGVITARIEKHGDTVVDKEGRYNLKMPFEEGPNDLKRVRMAQPYSGPDYGIHFPNPEGAEAVVAFIGGDIDRPLMLSTIPNIDHHTPSPNTKNKLASQNPGMGPMAVGVGSSYSDAQDAVTYEEEKKVIRTKRGHQLVMDDANGTANPGITLQVGAGEWPESAVTTLKGVSDPYWSSRIEMGGYRKKTLFEQTVDSATSVLAVLQALGKRADVPELAGIAASIAASQIGTGDYISDTFGDTAPVGIKGLTAQDVTFMGNNGVNLVMPNMLGMWGASVIPATDIGVGQLWVQSIVKAVKGLLYQEIIKTMIDEASSYKKKKPDPEWSELDEGAKPWWSWLREKKIANANSLFMSALGMPAIKLDSAAGINLTAYSKVSVVGGYDGIELNAKAHMKQHADLDFDIEAGQGITIMTKGEPEGSPGFLGIWPRLASFIPPAATLVEPGSRWSSKPSPDNCHITIMNENQDVRTFALKGHIQQKAKKHVIHTSTQGSVTAYAPRGNVNLENDYSGVRLLSGKGAPKKSKIVLETSGAISLSAGEGKAAITLHPDGVIDILGEEIRLNGKKMTIKGGQELNVEATKTKISAVPPAPAQAPQPPQAPDDVELPLEPEPIPPKTPPANASPSALKRITEINALIAESNALGQKIYLQKKQAYEQYLAQLDAYYQQLAQVNGQTGSPTAFIELKAQPGDIAVQCTNYAAESKLKYDYKGTLINGEAKGILSTKAALTKIE